MGYWMTSIGLIAFGVVGMLSIGRPFFLVGLAMLILGPLRRRPALFWPPLVALIAYNVGWWVTAPMSCTATQVVGGPSTTVCSSLLGIRYSGSGTYNPGLEPANQAGLLMAIVAFVVVLAAILWKRRLDRVGPRLGLRRLRVGGSKPLVANGPVHQAIRRSVSPGTALVAAGIGGTWIVGYLLIIQRQGTEMGSPGVVFYATFVGFMAALALGAAVLRGRHVQWAQTLLYAAAGGYLPAGILGLMSVGLPLIAAGMLALAAAGPRVLPLRRCVSAAALSTSVFLVGVALTIRVS